jgi:hypothetical protein
MHRVKVNYHSLFLSSFQCFFFFPLLYFIVTMFFLLFFHRIIYLFTYFLRCQCKKKTHKIPFLGKRKLFTLLSLWTFLALTGASDGELFRDFIRKTNELFWSFLCGKFLNFPLVPAQICHRNPN